MEREPEKYNGPRKYKPKRPFLGRNLSGQMPFLSVLLGREKVLDRLENEECSQWNINRRSETPQATLSAYYRSPEMERKICVSFEKLHVYEVKNIIFKILLLVWMQLYCQYHLRIKHNLLEEFIREQMHPIVFFSTWDFFNKKIQLVNIGMTCVPKCNEPLVPIFTKSTRYDYIIYRLHMYIDWFNIV